VRCVKAIVFLVLFLHTVSLATPVYAVTNVQYWSTGVSAEDSYKVKTGDRYVNESSGEKKLSVYSGSGFFITPNVVVTSNHVIRGASRIEIVYNNEIQLTGVVIGSDEASDLALLRVSGLEDIVSPLVLANSGSVRQGSRVYAIGFPLPLVMGMQPKLSEGIISSTAGLLGDLRMYQISTPVQPGNSGGPLLNDRAEVVGVVTGSLNAANMMKEGIIPQNVNYAVKINNICNLIDNCGLDVSFGESPYDKSLSAADVMDITRKAVVFIMVIR